MAGVYGKFDEKVEPDPFGGCWLWSGAQNPEGYGHLQFQGKDWRAHRLSFVRHKGEIPDGSVVRHKCDVPSCVNPGHLEIGTHADNAADKAKRKRSTASVPDCVVTAIRQSTKKGVDLAKEFSVSTALVSLIRNNKRRNYV